ncbi:MAG: alkaline phosphatase family protein [candidate division NC10 bacterium]
MMLTRWILFSTAAVAGILLTGGCAPASRTARPIDKINHLIVIVQENWSFDGLYGFFPGTNGIANAGATINQVDKDGQPYTTLPAVIDNTKKPHAIDARVPPDLPVKPFDLSPYIPPDQKTGVPAHLFYTQQAQINGGKMDRFLAWSTTGGLVMSYYDATQLPVGRLALQYTLADNFFHAAFGGSFLNHFWLICACTPVWPNAPANLIATFDAQGNVVKDHAVTPDGYVVNTALSINRPHPARITDPAQLMPSQISPTIGDRLNETGISWAWYAQGWDDALAGRPDRTFAFHHQPFVYFANYADGTKAKTAHLKDERDFLRALTTNTLPAVSFIVLLDADSEHPGTGSVIKGQDHVARLVKAMQASPYWVDSAIIITYDENGGRWDHVPPPVVDRWGPGTRVPAIIISPYAKRGFVDHTRYDTTSILKFIETRWNLAPLGTRDASANDLMNAFDFSQAPSRER